MFTGIVQTVGIVEVINRHKTGLRLAIKTIVPTESIVQGSSVAVNGACLTVVEKKVKTLWFDVVPETVRRTTMGNLKKGDRVNIEPSLRMGDEIGGHLVLGHVDGTGVVKSISHKGREMLMAIEVQKKLTRYIAEKGSVAVDGVSLTVARVKGNMFTIALVPYTLKHSTLGMLKKGDKVNIEVDVVTRYLERLRKKSRSQFLTIVRN